MKYLPVVWRFFFRNNGGYNITHSAGRNVQYIPVIFQTFKPEEWGIFLNHNTGINVNVQCLPVVFGGFCWKKDGYILTHNAGRNNPVSVEHPEKQNVGTGVYIQAELPVSPWF